MERIENFSSLFATVALPAYIGWDHWTFAFFILYAFVAGLALAAGERMTMPFLAGTFALDFARYASLRMAMVFLGGGLIYALALLLI